MRSGLEGPEPIGRFIGDVKQRKPLANTRFFYLVTPYSKYPGGLEAAFQMACEQAGLCIAAGVHVYCPIAHMHPIAVRCGMDPLDHKIWLPADEPMMHAASGLIIVMAAGWEESVGVKHETDLFTRAGKPIAYMRMGMPPIGLGFIYLSPSDKISRCS